jgi:hypothetical protein
MTAWSRTVEPAVAPDLASRCQYAQQALRTHGEVSGLPDGEDPQEAVVHLLTDLMHLSAELTADFSSLMNKAGHHFLEERLTA